MNLLNKNRFNTLNVENFNWSFKISKEIFDILDIGEDLVAWKMKNDEIVIFRKYKWDFFVEQMKMYRFLDEFENKYNIKLDKSDIFNFNLESDDIIRDLSDFSDFKVQYFKKWQDFIRWLYHFAQPVVLGKNKRIVLNWSNSLRKFLDWKDFSVSFCL